jgi:outer membrane receptor for ferrienterochelin and colicin
MGITLRSFWTAFTTDVKNLEGRPDDVDVAFNDLQSHVVDLEAEYDATFEWPIPHHLNIGVGYRYKSIDWAWLDSKHDEHHASAFIQDTMKFGEYVRVTASTRIDKHPLIELPVLSPRGAVVVRMTEESALRATVGTAFRSPAFLESYLRSKVPTPLRGITAYGIGNTELSPETMLSTEIGYSHQNDFFALEANFYMNLVDDLISLSQIDNYGLTDPQSVYDPSVDAYPVGELQWANGDVTYRQLGGELGIRVYPVTGLDVYLNYAYHDTSPTDSTALTGAAAEEERTSAHKINTGVQYRSPFGLDLALDVHLASEQTWVQAISSATSGSDVGIFRVPGYAIVNARIGYRLFDDALELAIIGNNVASTPFRQHPFGQKISRRIFGSATLRF